MRLVMAVWLIMVFVVLLFVYCAGQVSAPNRTQEEE